MRASSRIILNTLATYGRSLIGMALSLFSARWVLLALGQVDFGLYGVVGSVILLITFLNQGLSIGVSRFYAYSIGQGHNLLPDEAVDNLQRWFNTALSVHLVFPFLLIAIGYPVGVYAIEHWLTVPPDRVTACIWVFRISLVTAFVNMSSVPFVAMYTAHQYIAELAVFGLLTSFFTFVCAFFLMHIHSDRLIVYALYMMAISAGVPLLQVVRAIGKFPACRVRIAYLFHKKYLKELFGFVGWKMFGMSCVIVRGQGIPVLANLHFGPLVNAAYSVAYRLSSQSAALASAMMGAFQPALTSIEGKGDRQKMLEMTMQTCKFGTLLVLVFVIPLAIEMENVLRLWLKTPPQYAGALCNWMLAMLVVDSVTAGPMMAINAAGKIAVYEIIQGSVLFLALPAAWLFFHLGLGPASLGAALFLSTVVYCSGRLVFGRLLVQFSIGKWVLSVAVPVTVLIIGAVAMGLGITQTVKPGFFRLIVIVAVTSAVTAGGGWFLLLNKAERFFVRMVVAKTFDRLISIANLGPRRKSSS